MKERLQFYIDGKWVNPTTPKTIDVINPSNEEAFALAVDPIFAFQHGGGGFYRMDQFPGQSRRLLRPLVCRCDQGLD